MKKLGIFAVLALACALAAGPIKIGWASRDITPDFQVDIPGKMGHLTK